MRIIYNHLGLNKLRDAPQIGQLIQQAANKGGGRGKGGENVLPTQLWRGGGVQREEGRTTESNQATNKCNKYDDKGSKKQQYEGRGLRRTCGEGGVLWGQGHWARSQRSRSRKRRPQNGCLKTQLHNNLFTFFHTPSTLNELAAPAPDGCGEGEGAGQGKWGREIRRQGASAGRAGWARRQARNEQCQNDGRRAVSGRQWAERKAGQKALEIKLRAHTKATTASATTTTTTTTMRTTRTKVDASI